MQEEEAVKEVVAHSEGLVEGRTLLAVAGGGACSRCAALSTLSASAASVSRACHVKPSVSVSTPMVTCSEASPPGGVAV